MALKCEQDSEDSVTLALGSPVKVIPVPGSKENLWIYNDPNDGYHRLTLLFDHNKKLQSLMWYVREREPEIELKNSQKHFPDAKFVGWDAPWENPHAAPDERFYSDKTKGISITFRKTRQEVESISWYNPNTKPTADRKPAIKYEL
jgi:hypothetical protein